MMDDPALSCGDCYDMAHDEMTERNTCDEHVQVGDVVMDDLVAWLRAQVDEDERVARAIGNPLAYTYPDGHSDEYLEFYDRFDDARVLREVDVKRRIIDRYDDFLSRLESEHFEMAARDQVREYYDVILPLLALPFADRPGYRDEWRL